ncbi:MAG: hypothetical protein H6Q89_4381 [Myxococcaceae bacterium]|nr:hypothetical protein [Myxococcaceae bacterium]
MSSDVAIDAWLAEHGYGLPPARALAHAAIEEAGLTRAGKLRISNEKLPRVLGVLRERFCLHCSTPECIGFARASGRAPLLCDPKPACERCGGSSNRGAEADLIEACAKAGMKRLVIIGGSPAVREELEGALGSALQLRMIDGTERRTIDNAKADMQWGDLVLLWGASELHHKVSMQYTNLSQPELKRKLVRVQQRGIAALLHAAIDHLKR